MAIVTRINNEPPPQEAAIMSYLDNDQNVERSSGIEAPNMKLTGHAAEVYAVRISRNGKNIATAGGDRKILVYNIYGECRTWASLTGHKSAILEVAWSPDDAYIYSCGADGSVCIWDVEYGERLKKLSGHVSAVNSISAFYPYQSMSVPNTSHDNGTPMETESEQHPIYSFAYTHSKGSYSCSHTLVSAGDDGCTRVWDLRTRKHVMKADHQFQILSVVLDGHGGRIFCGSLDNTIRVYDIRNSLKQSDILRGHADSITGLDINPTGSHLLSNSMDQTIRLWDIQPYRADTSPFIGVLKGSVHNFEKNLIRVRWSPDGTRACAGSSDRCVYIWDMEGESKESTMIGGASVPLKPLLYRLPGHSGSVNDVAYHPLEPIVCSVSSDKTCFMGELS